ECPFRREHLVRRGKPGLRAGGGEPDGGAGHEAGTRRMEPGHGARRGDAQCRVCGARVRAERPAESALTTGRRLQAGRARTRDEARLALARASSTVAAVASATPMRRFT